MMRSPQPPDLDADARSIIDAARGGHDPNEMARARVRRGVEIKLAAGIALAVGPASSAFAGALKLTAAVVAVGTVVGAGVYVYPRHATKPAPVHATATRVVHAAPALHATARGDRDPRAGRRDADARARPAPRGRDARRPSSSRTSPASRRRQRFWAGPTRRSPTVTSSAPCRCSRSTTAGPARACCRRSAR